MIAAVRLGIAADELRTADGTVIAPDGRVITLADLATGGVTAAGSFANSKSTYAYGTAAAHVTVDIRTGQVALLDYVVVDDVGRAINPLTLHGQMIGGTVQGLGGVFGEQLTYDAEGQLLVGTLADYLLPVATDFPTIRAVTTQNHPSPNNPLGAKGRRRRRRHSNRRRHRERCHSRLAQLRRPDQHAAAYAAVYLGAHSMLDSQPTVTPYASARLLQPTYAAKRLCCEVRERE